MIQTTVNQTYAIIVQWLCNYSSSSKGIIILVEFSQSTILIALSVRSPRIAKMSRVDAWELSVAVRNRTRGVSFGVAEVKCQIIVEPNTLNSVVCGSHAPISRCYARAIPVHEFSFFGRTNQKPWFNLINLTAEINCLLFIFYLFLFLFSVFT